MECPEYKSCIDRRVADAAFKATIETKLINLESIMIEVRNDVKTNSISMNRLYVKVAGISGGIAVLGVIGSHIL